MGVETWKWFLATVPTAAPWVLFAIQYGMIRLHVRAVLRRRPALAAA